MIKIIPPGSFAFDDPVARLVDVHRGGVDSSWMKKRAAVLTREISDIRPEDGFSYIHLIDMGAQEAYGSNRNGDGFNEKEASFELVDPKSGPKIIKLAGGLMERHITFKTDAHVYKHHKNDDPLKKIGGVEAEAYNPDMRRGELIIKVGNDHPDWRDDLQKLAQGKDIPFSMACKVAYDICSYCGNRAASRSDYCGHLANHMNEITKSGHQIFAINDVPQFFDISKVFRPADRIAWSIQKVAGTLAPPSGAELAEMMGISAPPVAAFTGSGPANFTRKMSAIRKLAEIEKLVEGVAKGEENAQVQQMAQGCPHADLGQSEMTSLEDAQLGSALKALGSANICLSVRDFMRLVMGDKHSSIAGDIPAVEGMLPGLFSRLLNSGEAEECAQDTAYDSEHASVPRRLSSLAEGLMGDHSQAPGPVERRVKLMIIRGSTPRLASSAGLKTAAVSKKAHELGKEYAKYQLSFVSSTENTHLGNMLTVLGNCLKF